MRRMVAGSLLAILVASGWALANHKAEIDAARKQIKTIRNQETAYVKAIKVRYQAAIKQTHRTEEQLIKERAALKKEEDTLLALATSEADKEKIRTEYDLLRGTLRTDVKIDHKVIDALHAQENALVQRVQTVCRAQVKQLEAQIKAMEQMDRAESKAKSTHPKKK